MDLPAYSQSATLFLLFRHLTEHRHGLVFFSAVCVQLVSYRSCSLSLSLRNSFLFLSFQSLQVLKAIDNMLSNNVLCPPMCTLNIFLTLIYRPHTGRIRWALHPDYALSCEKRFALFVWQAVLLGLFLLVLFRLTHAHLAVACFWHLASVPLVHDLAYPLHLHLWWFKHQWGISYCKKSIPPLLQLIGYRKYLPLWYRPLEDGNDGPTFRRIFRLSLAESLVEPPAASLASFNFFCEFVMVSTLSRIESSSCWSTFFAKPHLYDVDASDDNCAEVIPS